MSPGRVGAGCALALAGAVLAALTRAWAWHDYEQTGFTAPTGAMAVLLAVLPAAVALAAVAALARPAAAWTRAAGLAAGALAGAMVASLLALGDGSSGLDAGAWMAGAAAAAAGAGSVLLTLGDVAGARALGALVAAVVGAATLAVILPPERPHPEFQIIR